MGADARQPLAQAEMESGDGDHQQTPYAGEPAAHRASNTGQPARAYTAGLPVPSPAPSRPMRYQRLDLNLLTALRALLSERNVTRAGEQLHVTQSAMSGMLARLREYFEDPLIVPVGRRMELTPLAESLQGKLNDLMLRLDATLSTRPEFDPAQSRRRFSIIASDYLIQVLMLPVLQALHHEAPGVTIEFRQPSNTAGQDLDNGEVDFVINPARFATATQASAVLFEDSYQALVATQGTPYGPALSLAEYRAAPHVTMEANGRPLFETWFIAEHGALPHTQVVVNNFSLLPLLLPGTARVATLHTRMAQQVVRQYPDVLRVLPLAFDTPRLVETLQWHRLRDLDPGSQWLREKILAAAAALPPCAAASATYT